MYEIVWLNKEEWLKYAIKVVENRGSKTDEELVLEASNFDFKFGSILPEPQSSSTETQNS